MRIEFECNHLPADVPGAREVDAATCPICLEQLGAHAVVGACNHAACERCLRPWVAVQGSCPICRRALRVDQLTPVAVRSAH